MELNPQRMARLSPLSDDWIQFFNEQLESAYKDLDNAKTIEEVRLAQGEIRLVKKTLTARANAQENAAHEARKAAVKAEREAEIAERNRIPAWERLRNGVARYKRGTDTGN